MSTQTKKKWLNVLKFFAAYLVAAWTFLQFIDWILNRYNVSPYWVDILLWLFIGIIPSLLIYLYHQERLNKRILKLREKIIFPLNIILLFVVLYFGFGNSDLGATTKSIDYTNEQGEQKSALITKEEFRTGFAIYNFEPKTKDSTKAWLEFGITGLLYEDLLQNKNLTPFTQGFTNTTDKVNNAKLFYDSYIDGEFEVTDSIYTITTFIRNSTDSKIIAQNTFKSKDLLYLIDEITVFITKNYTNDELNSPKYLDLNLKEFTSNSLKALEYYIEGDYTNAIKEDSTFALAYLANGKINLTYNQSKYEERELADKAYKYRNKLPLQKQGETLILKNLAYDQFSDAEELIKLQLEVDPSNLIYSRMLYGIYGRTKNIKDYTDHAYKQYQNNPNPINGFNNLDAAIINNEYDKILNGITKLELLQSNNSQIFMLKMMPQLQKGDIEAALKTQGKTKLLHPDLENLYKIYDDAIAYLKNNKPTKTVLQKFEGDYRSNNSEQTFSFWVKNNTLLQYVSNQTIIPFVLAGDSTLIAGHTLSGRTWKKTFLKSFSNQFYVVKNEQNNLKNSTVFWHWKIDDTILKAEALFEAKKLDSAKVAYKEAIMTNPKHYYLKDVLAHINYVDLTDSITIDKQFKDVVGTYGPRTVSIENGKLFYKRDSRARIELLPISENRYMNMSNLNDHFAFDYKDGKVINCYFYNYNIEDELWVKNDEEGRSLFLKD